MSPGWSNSSERMTWVKQCEMVVTQETEQQSKFGVDETAGWGKGIESHRNRKMMWAVQSRCSRLMGVVVHSVDGSAREEWLKGVQFIGPACVVGKYRNPHGPRRGNAGSLMTFVL